MVKQTQNQNQMGQALIPMLLAFCICFAMGMGTWGVFRLSRKHANIQLDLDRCIAQTTKQIADMGRKIDTLNTSMEITRASIIALLWNPPAQAPLRAALMTEFGLQEVLLTQWRVKQVEWLTKRGCSGMKFKSSLPIPLPGPPYSRLPPDEIGPQSLDTNEDSLSLRIKHGKQTSSSKISISENWKAQWSPFGIGSILP